MLAFEQINDWMGQLSHAPAIVKIVAFFLIWFLIWLPIGIPLARILKWTPAQPLTVEQKIPLVLSLYALSPLLMWGAARFETRPLSAYGLVWDLSVFPSIAIGLSVGTLGVCLLFAVSGWMKWATWQQPQSLQQVIPIVFSTLCLGLLISAVEESIFRGFVLNQLQESSSGWWAAVGSSIIFASLHTLWEGRKVAPQLPGLWLMGMVLVMARWVDNGHLGLACGLHAGWIWAMASVTSIPLIEYHPSSPGWITGLGGQPLAGGLGLLLLLATGGMLWSFGVGS